MKNTKYWVLTIGLCTLVSFQNCSKVAVVDTSADTTNITQDDPNPPVIVTPEEPTPEPSFKSITILLDTKMNIPLSFVLEDSKSIDVASVTLKSAQTSAQGKLEVTNSTELKAQYTPAFGYRGKDMGTATIKDKKNNTIEVNLIITVGNPLSDFQPALAIRGMGCIQCHANIKSNIITDFGYGNSYFFSANPDQSFWRSGGIYGDHQQNFNTMSLQADKSIFVPKAAKLPSVVSGATGQTTLAGYVANQLSQSSDTNTRAVKVQEKSNMYIGAPTEADIVTAFQLKSVDRYRYFKNAKEDMVLEGLKDQTDFFEISGNFSCDGDLVLRGPVYIDSMNLKTAQGCRMYVIGSVFIYGPINYSLNSDQNNLQITSTKAIAMGLGKVKNSANKFCESGSRYETDPSGYGTSSLTNRLSSFWTVKGNFLRQSATDASAFGTSVLAEASLIEKKKGSLMDAACRVETRSVSFEHILLNAPAIHSRYVGDVKGTVISEFAIMSLNQFKFEFDPVFQSVPVWPFLDSRKYLHME